MTDRQGKRLVAEGVVIVVSILAAFALDTWWDNHKNAEEEQRVLSALDSEFRSAREDLQVQLESHERILNAIQLISEGVANASRAGDRTVVLPDTALALLYIPPTTQLVLGTLDGLVASARLEIIRDPDLRSSLAAWGNNLAELTEEEWSSRELVLTDLDRVLRERVDVAPFRTLDLMMFRGGLEAPDGARSSTLPVDTELVGVLGARLMVQDHLVNDEFGSVFAEIDQILGLIDRSQK